MASYKELKAKVEDLMRQAEIARKAEAAGIIAEIKVKMKEYGISVADLAGAVKKPASRNAVAAKYCHPETGETWSGRGRPPHWLAKELAKGKNREDFLVG